MIKKFSQNGLEARNHEYQRNCNNGSPKATRTNIPTTLKLTFDNKLDIFHLKTSKNKKEKKKKKNSKLKCYDKMKYIACAWS